MSTYSHPGSLAGKSVIVTGAGQGIGKGAAAALAERGASVVLVDINEDTVKRAAAELSDVGYEVVSHVNDISEPANAVTVVQAAVAAFGTVHGLVNNAIAGNGPTPFTDLTDGDYDRVFDTGPRATFALMKAVYPYLKHNGGGSIVNLGSAAGAAGEPFFGTYGGAKEAIRGMSKVAALEWGVDQIRVNSICPFANSDGAMAWKQANPDDFDRAMQAVPLRRIGDTRTDVGALIAFLLGDDSTYVTGQTIFVDGGKASIR
ncbi:MAG TPA: SDR family NAD(P)-dependent oxidoreductase [Lacisediminihabitans sp.]|uniref:SDR family NAD(P)-dependent oxidoreductase n=1 Tax=Lacisediminihabitans sp. TaxID=2787631 RepID=UPI002ED7BFD7